MMVATAPRHGAFKSLLVSLGDKTAPDEDRIDAYLTLTERLRHDDQDILVDEICRNATILCSVVKRDILSDPRELALASLQALGYCFSLPDDVAIGMLKALCSAIVSTHDKNRCTRALWCVAKQNINSDIVANQVSVVLPALEHVLLSGGFQSATVEFEAMNVILRLIEQVPNTMRANVAKWGILVYPVMLNSAVKVAERALVVMESALPLLLSSQEELIRVLIPDLKANLIDEMGKMMAERREISALRAWRYYIILLGKVLHRSGSLLNDMLKIMEMGFKNKSIDILLEAYANWRHFIDSFVSYTDLTTSPKKRKLLSTPIMIKSSEDTPPVLNESRILTWWHLIKSMNKHSPALFKEICLPLLIYCFGSQVTNRDYIKSLESANGDCLPSDLTSTPTNKSMPGTQSFVLSSTSPQTPQLNFKTGPGYENVVSLGCEALYHYLNDSKRKSPLRFRLDPLPCNIYETSGEIFLEYYNLFFNCIVTASRTLQNKLEENLLSKLWISLIDRLSQAIQENKFKNHQIPTDLVMGALQYLLMVFAQSPETNLTIIDAFLTLPNIILTGLSDRVSKTEDTNKKECVVILVEKILSELIQITNSNNYSESKIIGLVSEGSSRNLDTFDRILSVLKESQLHKLHLDQLWTVLAKGLLESTNEVNQGGLEPVFDCIYNVLEFPFTYILNYELNQDASKQILKVWEELFRTFMRCSSLIPSVDLSEVVHTLCKRLLKVVTKENLLENTFFDATMETTSVIVDCMELSTVSTIVDDGRSKTNPRNQKHHKLSALIEMLRLLTETVTSAGYRENRSRQNENSSLIVLVNMLALVFGHISGSIAIRSTLEKLSLGLGLLLKDTDKRKKTRQHFPVSISNKIERLLDIILTCLQSRYMLPYDSDLLKIIAPILEGTLCNSKRQIQNRMLVFWNATFATSSPLTYPISLRSKFTTLRKTTPIALPGWEDNHDEEDDECQIEQFEEPSLANEEVPSTTMSTPTHVTGSFLRKAAKVESTIQRMSPFKQATPASSSSRGQKDGRFSPHASSARRKLPLSVDDEMEGFVAIPPSPKKPRLLTEHQKDVLETRKEHPAMYNGLDQSQDGTSMTEMMDSEEIVSINEVTRALQPQTLKNDADGKLGVNDSLVVILKECDTHSVGVKQQEKDGSTTTIKDNSVKVVPESPVKSKEGIVESAKNEKNSEIQRGNCSSYPTSETLLSSDVTDHEDGKAALSGGNNLRMEIDASTDITPKENNIQFTFPSANLNSPVQKRPPIPFSPKTSPTGILKRWSSLDSPSPSGKARRVTFAIPSETKTSHDDISVNGYTTTSDIQDKKNIVISPVAPINIKDNAVNASPSTPISKYQDKILSNNCIFPDLVECQEPINQVLPSLMSSLSCSRGLEQLVRAMNICTVGDLCSLSENQVQSLPIRSPKIPNIKNALRKFQNLQDTKTIVKSNGKIVLTETDEGNQETDQSVVPAAFRSISHESDDLSVSLNESELSGDTNEIIKGKEIQNDSITKDHMNQDNNCNDSNDVVKNDDNDACKNNSDTEVNLGREQYEARRESEDQYRSIENDNLQERTVVDLTQLLRDHFDRGELNTLTPEQLLKVYGDLNVLISQIQYSLKVKMS
ncbi:Telomere-associated protein RIF1 [Trichoplax sp. H2]|nr:Telomere-associated protein RIF1 [Trichoplax sp. H2]|eukprot:RDD40447.1 Telomere-associated protein RIF1 [Trichoplax sp. H2]